MCQTIPSSAVASRTILLVDDSMTLRIQVGRVLRGAGFQVIEAVDGLDALEKLASANDLALIVCDVNMPRMSGIELLEALKARSDTLPPILMLTTEGNPELVRRARASGAKAWMTKPFKPDLLLAAAMKLTTVA